MISSHAKTSQSHKSRLSAEGGVALVLTLLIISMLVVVVVGFTVSTRTEQIAARNANYKILAEQLARDATGRALQKLGSGFVTTDDDEGVVLIATQPGRISRKGKPTLNLFSSGAAANINTVTTPAWITGLPSDNIDVGWENVLDAKNKVVGRVAYYVDDESAKLPLNAATPTRNSLNPASTRPFSFAALIQSGAATAADRDSFGAVVNGTFGPGSISNWTYFFVPEQARGSVFRSTIIANVGAGLSNWFRIASRFTVAGGSESDSVGPKTPWGTDKVLINELPLADVSVTDLTRALTDTNLTEIFGGHFGNKYGEQGVRQLAANIIQLRSDHWKRDLDFRGTNPVVGAGALADAEPAPAPTSRDIKKTNGIPEGFLGHVPFPMLTEVAVSYDYGWTTTTLMTVRFFVECTLYNPYPEDYSGGGAIFAQIDKAIFPVYYGDEVSIEDRWRGPFGTPGSSTRFSYNDNREANPWGDEDGRFNALNPVNGIRIEPIGEVPSNTSTVVTLVFEFNFEETNPKAQVNDETFPTYVILDQIRLLADAAEPQSVRDWVSGYDFFNALSSGIGETAQFDLPPVPGPTKGLGPEDPDTGEAFIVGGANLTAEAAPPPPTKLVKRYDPRMRLALEASEPYQTAWPRKIWFEVPYEEAVAYSASAVPNPSLPADPGFTEDLAKLIYNSDVPPILAFNVSKSEGAGGEGATAWRGLWSMPADLGKVFTGAPLRTLRMQPQPAPETEAQPNPYIPDWVLLDMVDFTDGTKPLTTVNPNSRYVSAGGSVAGFAAGLRSQLDVLTNASARTNVVNPSVPTDIVANVVTPPTNPAGTVTNLVAQAANAQWSGAWGERRQDLGFPTSAIMLPSEIVEVAGFADYAEQDDDFKLNEYRIGALFPGLSTKSRFFKIYAVAEAFEGTSQSVAATALLQTLVEVVEADDSTDPPSITTIYQYPPAD